MSNIWFCKYEEVRENDFNLEYIKLIYENIKDVEINEYIKHLCNELKYTFKEIIDNRYVKLDDKYMLFIEELEA